MTVYVNNATIELEISDGGLLLITFGRGHLLVLNRDKVKELKKVLQTPTNCPEHGEMLACDADQPDP